VFGPYPKRKVPVTIRPMNVWDIPAGLRLCRLSGWNQLEDDWRMFLASSDGGGRIAERDGNAAGTVAWLRYGERFSWLSMMLVDPDARRSGIGTRLMEAALEALAGESCVMLDATPLGEPLYRRFGFSGEYELVRAKLGSVTIGFQPGPAPVGPTDAVDLEEVLARDRAVFGADRGALLRSLHRRAPELAWIARVGKSLTGYCFGRPGYLYRQIGPVAAESEAVARDLVGRCLASDPGGAVAVDVPRAASGWLEWLCSVGFTVERPFLRMRRGGQESAGFAASQFAIAGPEFG
jgi:GNAT superfamily N-acetyltransferase